MKSMCLNLELGCLILPVARGLVLVIGVLGTACLGFAQFEAPSNTASEQRAASEEQAQSAPPADAVAMVNNEPITQTEFRTALEAHLKQVGSNDANTVQQAQKQVISGLVESRLVEQHLIQEGPEVPRQEIEAVVDQYKEQIQAQGVPFEQFLATTGYSEQVLQRRIQGSLAWRKYQEQEMTEEKLQQHFTENQNQFAVNDFEQAKPMVAQSYANSLWAEIVEEVRPQAEIQVKPMGQAAPVGQGLPQQP